MNHNTLFLLGRPFAPFYALSMRLREKLYARNLLVREKVAVPTISVGNLVLGGTGKTPMVRYLAKFLKENGCNPAIISRGYKGTANDSVNIVADKEQILLSAKEAGDEPYMLAATLPKTLVVTGKKRINPAKKAVEMGADCLILDDGFQHLAIERDINIVLFDATYQAGNSRILPAGPLREPVAALNRADCFVITGTTDKNRDRAEKFSNLLKQKFTDVPIFFAGRSPLFFTNYKKEHSPTPTRKTLAFCGIARPENFKKSLEESGVVVQKFLAFADHSAYTTEIAEKIEQQAQQCGAELLITTEKDSVKLSQISFSMPLLTANFNMAITVDFQQFLKRQPALQKLILSNVA